MERSATQLIIRMLALAKPPTPLATTLLTRATQWFPNLQFFGLFLPKPDFPEDPMYFVEVQFQRDDDIYWRIITETFLYINQYKPQRRWQAVLLFAQCSLDPGVPFIYETSLAQEQIRRIYLLSAIQT
ncbi:MAG: DUF2887 domain-containing protein [Nostoc sp.]|uniref:DUF2887 domain-containing protein n=1 Tax=Nostoc sp. TaxID=1180 RepID=UPI002FF9F0B5